MKVSLHQINTTVGDFRGNVRKILEGASVSAAQGCGLAVFPEMAVPGYAPLDLLENPSFVRGAAEALRSLQEGSRALPIAVVAGAVIPSETPGEGKPLSNAAVLLSGGVMRAVHRKVLLPTYDVFDESRHFEPGRGLTPISFSGREAVLSICEDIWNDKTYWARRIYHLDPVEAFMSTRQLPLVNIAASPYSQGKGQLRLDMLANTAKRFGVPVIYVNLVGGNDSLVFDGRSLVMDPRGRVAAVADAFREQVLVADLDVPTPMTEPLPDFDDVRTLHGALVTGLRDYAVKCGFRTAVLGLSGGIDSALTACIAVDALGNRSILGVLMPSLFTSPESVEDALSLARNLDMRTKTIPITGIYGKYLEELADGLEGLPGNATEENIQARIRGNILMALSNRFGHLVLSTGNKSELATGYCTLYGDMSGGLAVISDLYKGEVRALAAHINRGGEVIPGRTLSREPTAELRPHQRDTDTLPPYPVLDQILKAYIEDGRTIPEIADMGFDFHLVRKVLDMLEGNEYKRQQAAPGIKVSWKAFGLGRRYPIAKARFF